MRVLISYTRIVARAIRLAREDANLTNAKLAREIAERLGEDKDLCSSLSEWESGKNLPSTKHMEALILALRLDGAEFANRFMREAVKQLRRDEQNLETVPGTGTALVRSDEPPVKRKRGRPRKPRPGEPPIAPPGAPSPPAKPRD